MSHSLALASLLIAVVGCRSSSPTPTAPPPPPREELAILADPDALARWADRELADAPSAVVGLIDRDGIRWSRGVGARDARGGAAPDARTVYRIGSVTKLLTATALLQQRDAGALRLDDPIATHVPELATRLPGVTLRHLVTHTSGVPSVGDSSAPYWETTPPTEAAMLRAVDVPVDFPPGSATAYSNAGMALAGLAVTRAAGEPWRPLLARRVLAPLGMTTATWDRADVPVDRLAIGVDTKGAIDPPHWQLGAFEPAGGLYASLDDLTGLARLALGAYPDVLAPATLAEALADDPLPGPHGVAWLTGTFDGVRVVSHAGSTIDYSSSLVALPDRGLAVIVLGAGPDAARFDCVAAMLLVSAVTKAPLGSCVPEPIADAASARATIALDRLRALLAVHDDAAITAAFTPEFLTAIPVAQLRGVFDALAAQLGACDRHELGGVTSGVMQAVLHCAKSPIGIGFAVEDAPPHRFTSLRFE